MRTTMNFNGEFYITIDLSMELYSREVIKKIISGVNKFGVDNIDYSPNKVIIIQFKYPTPSIMAGLEYLRTELDKQHQLVSDLIIWGKAMNK